MNDIAHYFEYDSANAQLPLIYGYLAIAAIVVFFLILRGGSRYKIELFFLSFYLVSGNLNNVLTISIPGLDFFEIQPIRFIYLLFLLFIIRKTLLSRDKRYVSFKNGIPMFLVALLAFMVLLTLSVLINIEFNEGLKIIVDAVAFLILIFALRLMADKPSYDIIGKAFIIGAVVSSIVGLVQLTIDPYFLRIGSARPAFGDFIRSNGLFSTEYYNSYFLIIAIAWALVTLKNNKLKIALVALFSIGVISTFQRMSWIILALVVLTYLVYIKKTAIDKLVLAGLALFATLLSLSVLYYQDIMKSTLVKERLSDSIDGRKKYYATVIDNIGKKPLLGYGDLKNEVYYVNLLRITGSRDRATAKTGSLHSGYFSSMFEYGIPAFVCFTLFVLLSVRYYASAFRSNLYYVIPFLVGIIFMVANFTNTFLFLSYISVLYAIHIGMGMGLDAIRKKNLIGRFHT